jgi:hypothetical protein
LSESLGHLGHDLVAFVVIEHVLDERPLQGVAGAVAEGIDGFCDIGVG